MKRLYPLLLLTLAAACTKKKTCTEHYEHLGCRIAFRGFPVADLDSVWIRSYGSGGAPDKLYKVDLVFFQAVGDTLYATDSNHYQPILEPGGTYDVTLRPAGNTFRIGDFEWYRQDGTYETENSCGNGGGMLRSSALSATVDGKKVRTLSPKDQYGPQSWVLLQR